MQRGDRALHRRNFVFGNRQRTLQTVRRRFDLHVGHEKIVYHNFRHCMPRGMRRRQDLFVDRNRSVHNVCSRFHVHARREERMYSHDRHGVQRRPVVRGGYHVVNHWKRAVCFMRS